MLDLLIGGDCGTVHGGVAVVRVPGADSPFEVRGVAWDSASDFDEAMLWLELTLQALLPSAQSVRARAEAPFTPRGAPPTAGVAQARALGRLERTLAAAGVPSIDLVTPSAWRRAWGIPTDSASRASTASRAWGRLVAPEVPIGRGDHQSDAILIALSQDARLVGLCTAMMQRRLQAGDADALKIARRAAPGKTAGRRAGRRAVWTAELVESLWRKK